MKEVTVFLIQSSLVLGYIAGHTEMDVEDREYMEMCGCNFGYIFQWLNDIELYSKQEKYLQHKGSKDINFYYGRKNIAFLRLYSVSTQEEKLKTENEKLNYSQAFCITYFQMYIQF